MAFEDLLSEVGDKRTFQNLQVFSLAIPLIFIASHCLIENFTAFVPEHWCWVHLLDNTSASLNISGNLNFSSILKLSIPLDTNGKLEKCHRFFWPQWQSLAPSVTGQNLSQLEMEPCVDGWVYDQSIFTSSIMTEWDLVCHSWKLKSFCQSIFLAGILVGYLLLGYVSDRFGRKRMLPPSYLMLAISSTGASFAQSFPVYCCLRFLLGFSISGIILFGWKLVIEWTTSQHRPLVTIILSLSISLEHQFLGILSHGIQEWRKLQLVVSAPCFAFFLTSWWLPESARWLVIHNKYDDALKMLRKVAKINGVKDKILTVEALRSTMERELTATQTRYTILNLVRFPILRTRILCMSFARPWHPTGMLSYGLSLDLQNLGSNIQMLQVLLGVSAFLSRVGALFLMNRLGLRTTSVACLLLAGLFILPSAFLPQGILRVVLAILGISCIVVCVSSNTLYFNELLPTKVRNTCLGFIFLGEQIGSVLAPLVNTLRQNIPALPQIIFAVIAITASFAVFFFLPETQNQPMPDTIQDIECGHSREEARPREEGDRAVKISQF
ncbi:steroid transmembrane transporter SLC22A24-like [Trichosurus vulpecula]|uniref:steroid transmembrane transporter SLC22A24-like n=1 Tax=Trichosurus vulpecula TaxID=9337 RepID=UPI00186B302D|nr:steroid transmembrane transporter SLC22A24-like [Trichosurus vulpecula]